NVPPPQAKLPHSNSATAAKPPVSTSSAPKFVVQAAPQITANDTTTAKLNLCRDVIRELMYFPSWPPTCSYGWVIFRDGGMLLTSVCALLGIRYALIVDEPSAYRSLTVWYNDSRRAYIPPRYTPGRQWRRRRMGKLQCTIRRFTVVKGIYSARHTIQYLRQQLMGRMS
ncbi:unnamed protein product, partial [Adineta steineri]